LDLNTLAPTALGLNNSGYASPEYLTPLGGSLFFAAASTSTSTGGKELLRIDGPSGTPTPIHRFYDITSLAVQGDNLYVAAAVGSSNPTQYWTVSAADTDVTPMTTFATGAGGVYSYSPGGTGMIAGMGDAVYFGADDGTSGTELWKYDTASGPAMVKDITEGSYYGSNSSYPSKLTSFQGAVYFAASDSSGVAHLWKTAGTADTTTEVSNVCLADSYYSYAGYYAGYAASFLPFWQLNGVLVLPSSCGDSITLWATNGEPANATQLGLVTFDMSVAWY
jgi:ELWxxDGT repeat protein